MKYDNEVNDILNSISPINKFKRIYPNINDKHKKFFLRKLLIWTSQTTFSHPYEPENIQLLKYLLSDEFKEYISIKEVASALEYTYMNKKGEVANRLKELRQLIF